MVSGVIAAAGGLGLFLIGMLVMTDGLRGLAGDALQRILQRFTRSPASGVAVGAMVTAVIQSSSATTVTAIGFVGAGLLTFSEAVGIVLGADIGTTVTGWMVQLIGFELDLAAVMPIAVLLGALLRLFGRGRWGRVGLSLAGFGLVFLGIAAMQQGMSGLEGTVTPEALPDDTWLGRLALVFVGIALTVVTQSSSAGVAAALAALGAGAISFPQAAAMVIGMDVGTTVTALIATLGASLPARRTGWAHVIYNMFTGSVAFFVLPLYAVVLDAASPGVTERSPGLCLVGFHTFFNLLGVSLVLPFARRFAALVERLIPDRPAPFTERLDPSLQGEPEVALRALVPTLGGLGERAVALLRARLEGRRASTSSEELGLVALALDEVQHYLGQLAPPSSAAGKARHAAALHTLDQTRRLVEREQDPPAAGALEATPELGAWSRRIGDALAPPPGQETPGLRESPLAELRGEIRRRRAAFREDVAARTARGEISPGRALEIMDTYRWLERVTHNAWRIAHHVGQLGQERPATIAVEPPEPT